MPPELADVSVVIPAWRAAATIKRALTSVAAQTVPPREVIVVDDGSDDGTADTAEACAPTLGATQLVVLRNSHAGAGAARNAAFARAKGRYVAFLDADDEWLPEKLARSLDRLENTGATFVSHDMIAVGTDGRGVYLDCAGHFAHARDPFVALLKRGFVATSTVVARREAALAAGGFNPQLPAAQDYDLWLAMASQPGTRFDVFPEALTRYHRNPSGITAKIEQRRRCSMVVLRRHAPTLRGRRGALSAVLARVLIIHYEAAAAYWKQSRPIAAVGVGLGLLPTLVAAAAALLTPLQRRTHVVGPEITATAAKSWPLRESRLRHWPAIAGVLWMTSVIAAYYFFNWGYYVEKIAVFGRFLIRQ